MCIKIITKLQSDPISGFVCQCAASIERATLTQTHTCERPPILFTMAGISEYAGLYTSDELTPGFFFLPLFHEAANASTMKTVDVIACCFFLSHCK